MLELADMLHDVTAEFSRLKLLRDQPALMSKAWDSKSLWRVWRNGPQVGEIVQHYVYLPFFDGVGKGGIVRRAMWGWVEIVCSEKWIKIDRSYVLRSTKISVPTVLLFGLFQFSSCQREMWIRQEPSRSVAVALDRRFILQLFRLPAGTILVTLILHSASWNDCDTWRQ
jgi:hypothetical protein